MSDRPETPLEMARRHVRGGEKRLARQTALVVEMDSRGHHEMASLGREILENMRSALELHRDHLREIEGRLKR
jgi:hypothetical protein